MSTQDTDHTNKKLCTSKNKSDSESFTAREYQIEILEEAREKNTIACLGTGTGKTFIAVLLIRENAKEVRIPFSEGGKRIFFLVPTVPLVNQQRATIEKHTDLNVKGYFGEMAVDSWKIEDWLKEFVEHEVLVMTAEIFRIILDHAFISPRQIQLLIFDECHRAQKDHPYRQAMKYLHDTDRSELPRIFGLSASLLNGKCKPTQLEKKLRELESTMLCSITTASDIVELQKYGTDPDEYVVYFSSYEETAADLMDKIEKKTIDLKQKKTNSESHALNPEDLPLDECDVIFFDKPVKCLKSLLETLKVLGPWCTYKAAEIYLREIGTLLLRPFSDKYKDSLQEVQEFLKYVMKNCFILNGNSLEISEAFLPDKLKRLLQIFVGAKKSKKFQNFANLSVNLDLEQDPEKYHSLLKLQKTPNSIISSIVFVQQRVTAYVLCEWLKEIKEMHPDLSFMKPDFIVGHGSLGLTETAMSEKLQGKKVEAFRDGQCNILVATCVLEEGMDIRQCNVVVRFDLPPDFRSYVQSKGRARAKNSIYILMVEEGPDNSKFLLDMCNFKTIEKLLLSRCHQRNLPSEEEISEAMADSVIQPYMPYGKTGPRITMTSAMSLINRYCSNLPSDMATKLVPRWTIKKVDPNLLESEYVCELKMPINSPLRKTIISDPMRKKKLAKMSAALKACQILHDIGELNEHLVPLSCLVEKALDEEFGDIEEEETIDGVQPGTNRRRQVYDKHVPIFLQNAKPVADSPCYLHVINMTLINPLPEVLNPRGRPIIDPKQTSRGLGLLCCSKLPPVNSFPVFTKCGKIMVEVSFLNRPGFFTEEEIKRIEEFHRFIFSDALFLEKGKTFDPGLHSYYILPTIIKKNQKSDIDWDFINSVKEHIYHEQKKGYKPPPNIFNENLFHDAVLLRSYKLDKWDKERPTLHHVMRILKNMSPNSIVDSKTGETFKSYYKAKYGVEISDVNQPLVETVQYASVHLWKPYYTTPKQVIEDSAESSKSKQKRMDYQEFLVPELCFIHPFPSSFLFQVLCLPTVLFRLNGLLLAEEIRQEVSKQMKVGCLELEDGRSWEPFHLETSDKGLREYLFRKNIINQVNSANMIVPKDVIKEGNYIVSFELKEDISLTHCPSPNTLLQALTTKGAEDEFDLERLEMIGDSFLKYVMSVKAYIKHPEFDEGKLTLFRSKLIQNLHLYQKAKKKNLAKYMTTTKFDTKETWLPPCYTISEHIDETTLIKKTRKKITDEVIKTDLEHKYFTKQVISDKNIADCVEALIGAYLLTSGPKGALKFMTWLGLKPLINETNDFHKWPPAPPNPILSESDSPQQRIDGFTSGFDRFEKIIGYRFKNKAYLLQAFTHQSYQYNDITDCYQRLEFLGDAVLDYLITRQLYEDPNDHSPGKLTDLRSAMVNNIFFASLAVKFKYNDYLKMLSPNLFKLMNHYIELLKESEEFKFFEDHLYYLKEVECFELEEVEVPKALGDVFESVAGAIYLDSGMSLDAVWKVYFPMIKPSLDHLSKHVPISPVRELYEMEPKLMFGKPIEKNGKTYIEVFFPDGTKKVGVGPNKKVAKRSAAKRALAELKPDPMDCC